MLGAEQIARVCHEANRAYQVITGEPPSPPWDDCTSDMRDSAVAGVLAASNGATPEQLHDAWCLERYRAGWRWGSVKDPQAMTHPCLVTYDALPDTQRAKDHLFGGIVAALTADA